jgi:Ser/Thr protein kinase RdoA (MazF antagonist)
VTRQRIQELTSRIYERSALEELPAHLEGTYGIRVDGVERFDAGVMGIERADGPDWVARVFPAGRSKEAVAGDADVLRFLEKQGFPAERCAHPDPVSVLADQCVLVTEHLSGPKADPTAETLKQLGDLLGRLQTLPSSDQVARAAGSLHHWSVDGGGPGADLAAASSWLEAIEPDVSAEHRPHFGMLREQIAAADDFEALPRALVHPDFQQGNAIVATGRGLVIVDWTGAGQGPRVVSLAVLLWHAVVRNRNRLGLDGADAVVSGYRPHVRIVEEELSSLSDALRRGALIYDCFQLCIGRITAPEIMEGMAATSRIADAIANRVREAFGGGLISGRDPAQGRSTIPGTISRSSRGKCSHD